MDYLQALHLKREAFSNAPDPAFFYATAHELECLHKLEIAIRLRRGLNLVLGDVGAGKTTLSRVLVQSFDNEGERFRVHMVLDPGFQTDREMLVYLLRLFGAQPSSEDTVTVLKDQMQHILFQQGVEQKRLVVLLIDEGQKFSPSGLEILRELLNFESNEYKLLQVVVFAQLEFWDRIRAMPNLLDRINLVLRLRPMSLPETRAMIHYRLVHAGLSPGRTLFSDGAVRRIYRATRGHPRKIIALCHHALLRVLMLEADRVTPGVVREVLKRMHAPEMARPRIRRWLWTGAGACLLAGAALAYVQWDRWVEISPGDWGSPATAIGPAAPRVRPRASSAGVEHAARREVENVLLTASKVGRETGDEEARGTPIHKEPAGIETAAEPAVELEEVESWSAGEWFQLHPLDAEGFDSSRTVVVRKGETLSGIIQRYYDIPLDPRLIGVLKEANPKLTDPDRLRTGQTLVLPPIGEEAPGFYGDNHGWFTDEERAALRAREMTREAGPLFLTRTRREGLWVYGVFKAADRPAGAQAGHSGLVWIDRDEIIRIYDRRR